MDAAEEGPGVLLAVKSDQWEEVNARVSPYGVLTLGRPFSRGMFSQAVGLLLASQAKAERYRAENEKLRQKLEELRVVSRAKCLLVEYLHLDEESAHKYMERQAMEERKTRPGRGGGNPAGIRLKRYDTIKKEGVATAAALSLRERKGNGF